MSEVNIMDQVLGGIKGIETRLSEEFNGQIKKYEEEVRLNGQASAEAKTAVSELSKKFEDAMTEIGQKMSSYKGDGSSNHQSTAGESLVASEEFKSLITGRTGAARIEVKNTINSIVGTNVYPQNNAGIIPGPFAPLTIRDILPTGATSAISVVGTREKSFSNKAAPVTQGNAKPESDIVFEQINTPIETIATWIKVSNQLLADAPAVVAYVDTRLRYMLNAVIDNQLLNGDGTAPSLKGLTRTANPYTAVKGDTLVDAVNRAKYQLWALGYAPDFVVVNPADWSTVEISKDTMNRYLYGTPGTGAQMSPFGIPVVLSNNIAKGNILIGNAARACMLWDRQTLTVEAGFVNTDFTSNLVTLRAETRLGLETSVPGALLYGAFTSATAEEKAK